MNSTLGRWLTEDGTRNKPTEQARSRFEKNRNLLAERFPQKTKRLQHFDFKKSRFTTLPSQTEQPCLIGFREGGQLMGLDDPSDPVGTQLKWFDHFTFSRLTHAILLGFGAGHIHERLAKEIPQLKKLVVIEPHSDLLATACATYDLTEVISNPQVSIWSPEDGYNASLWTTDWLEGFDQKGGDQVGFLLNPFFLRSAPEFLADYLNWLRIKDDKFCQAQEVLESKFPLSPGVREDWEWGITLTGIKPLQNLGKGLIGVVVAGGDLGEEEIEFLMNGDPARRLVIASPGAPKKIHSTVDGFVVQSQDSVQIELESHQQLFAEIGAACQNSMPPTTVIYRTEVPPQKDQILPPITTLGHLKNKGTLLKQLHPAGTLIDLCLHLGCSEILLMGVTPQKPQEGLPDYEGIGLSEQIRQSKRQFFSCSRQTCSWLSGVSPIDSKAFPKGDQKKKSTLPEAVDLIRNRPPSLPAAKSAIDRSFMWNGVELVTQGGLLKKPAEGNLLEILFHANLECLGKSQPEIAALIGARIANPSPEESYQLGLGPEGFPHFSIVKDGKRNAMSPMTTNPWKDVVESETWNCLFTECANIVVGLGLGFHVESILERTSGKLMIWEPIVDRLMAAMHVRNLIPLFTSERIDWVVGKPALEAAGQFVDSRTQQMYYHPVNWEPYVEPGMRQAYARHVKDFLDCFYPRVYEIRAMRNEAIASAKKWAIHFLRNTPRKAEAASLRLLRNRFENFPAIIVSAGPSLDETVHLLNEVKDRALIFVVDTSFRVVSDREIDRHFVVSVDQKDATLLHFADRTPRDTDILIATSGAPPLVWDLFKGPSFFGEFETGSGEKSKILSWIAESLNLEEEYLYRGNSVAISSIGAAKNLGCDPIILLGQDLAILPDRTHAEGTIYPVRPGLSESTQALNVPAIGGGEVQTTQWLKNIQNNLEYTLLKYNLNVINATSRGARIRGTREIPFQEILKNHLGDSLPIFEIVSEVFSNRGTPDISNMHREVQVMQLEIDGIVSRAEAQLKELKKLQKRIDRGDFPEDCPKRFRVLQKALIDMGLEDTYFQRMQDFVYREANRFSEQHVRVQSATDPKIKLKFQVERMIPLLESLKPGMGEAQEELNTLTGELSRRFHE